jgi:hypothetical protein
MSGDEFALFAENIDNVKADCTSYYPWHYLLGLNCWPFSFGRLFIRRMLDQLVVDTEIKPRFVKRYNILPGPSLLGFEFR